MDKKKAVFVLGTLDHRAAKRGEALTEHTLKVLTAAADGAGVEADVVFAVQDPFCAGQSKTKIKMEKIRKERSRVLEEIDLAKPDFIMCFGPTATASIFDRGNCVEREMLRQVHYPFGEDRYPVCVTYGMSNVNWKAGLAKWLELDVAAAAHGWTKTVFGKYTILLPDDPAWEKCPRKLRNSLAAEITGFALNPPLQEPFFKGIIGYDLETFPGKNPWHPNARIRMAMVSDQVGRAWVVQAKPDSTLPQWVYDLIEDPNIVKSGSFIAFDYRWHRRFGHKIVNMYDTSTHEHIIDESNPKKDLKSLTFRYVPRLGDYSKELRDKIRSFGPGERWDLLKDEEMYEYAGADAEASLGAYLGQQPLLKGFERPVSLYRDLYPVLAEMQHTGCHIDIAENRRLDQLYEKKLGAMRQEIVEVLGPINLNSPSQLADALKRAIPEINLSKKRWEIALSGDDGPEISTEKIVLMREDHKHPVIKRVLEYRRYIKRRQTYLTKIHDKHLTGPGGSFIYPSYNTDVVETGRLSMRDPSGHNIPRKDQDHPELTVKKQFTSRFPGGSILEGDMSQVEIRIAAWVSQDPKMIAAVESEEDIHIAMSALMLGKTTAEVTEEERQRCKERTFLILYGGGAFKLAEDLKISRRNAQRMIDEYYEAFPGLKVFIDQSHELVQKNLYSESAFGFIRRYVEPERWKSSDGWHIFRQDFNHKIQNPAACLTYCSMIWLHNYFIKYSFESKIILQVHDSIIVDVFPGEELAAAIALKQALEIESAVGVKTYAGIDINIPITCDIKIGKNWGELHTYEFS